MVPTGASSSLRDARVAIRAGERDRYACSMAHTPIRSTGSSVLVDVLVVANASRREITGIHGDRVKIRVPASPEKGKANAAVVDLVRDETGASHVEVVSGHATRVKTLEVWGIDSGTVRRRLLEQM
jgi:uncharacterized protein (TIGR00251 family)